MLCCGCKVLELSVAGDELVISIYAAGRESPLRKTVLVESIEFEGRFNRESEDHDSIILQGEFTLQPSRKTGGPQSKFPEHALSEAP